jgi:integrase/recombinase XerD
MGRPRVGATGPLALYAPGFGEELSRQGFTTLSAGVQLKLLASVSRWLEREGLGVGDLSPERLERFVEDRRGQGYTRWRSSRAAAPLLGYLAGMGVLPASEDAPITPVDELVERFRHHLIAERGLVQGTVDNYVRIARRFVSSIGHDGQHELLDPGQLTADDVIQFVLGECARRGAAAARNQTQGLRSLLRFWYLEGTTAVPLAEAVPTVAGWRGGGLPRGLDAAQAELLRRSCDRRTAVGRRDYAVITLLVRLGLRAAEVAAMRLDDVDWRRGEIVVRGKGRRLDRLPLPVDVGDALAGYLRRGRPRTSSRALFVRARAPLRGLTNVAVNGIVGRACARAGLPPVGPHRLRHTAASEMLRAGGSLPEIAQVLRHRSQATTALYAKVDHRALRALAERWPGGAI